MLWVVMGGRGEDWAAKMLRFSFVRSSLANKQYIEFGDPDPEFWPKFDPGPGLGYQFKKNLKIIFGKQQFS